MPSTSSLDGVVFPDDVGTPVGQEEDSPGGWSSSGASEVLRQATTAEFVEKLPAILQRLLNDPRRWVLIAEFGPGHDRYMQFMATEEHLLVFECVSNRSTPGSLSVAQEEALSRLGWTAPRPSKTPNWCAVDELLGVGGAVAVATRALRNPLGDNYARGAAYKRRRARQRPRYPKLRITTPLLSIAPDLLSRGRWR